MNDMRVDNVVAALRLQDRTGDSQPVRADAWLLQLERARWEAQPRYESGGGDSAAGTESFNRFRVETRATGVRSPDDMPLQQSQAAAMEHSAPQGFGGDAPGPQPQATPRTAHGVAAFVAIAAPTARLPQTDSLLRVALRGLPSTARDQQWAPRSVHVHAGEQSTSVWVRDARLLPHEAVRLLEQLRPLMAQRHSAEVPVRLTVNGQPVQAHLVQEKTNAR